MLVCKMAKVQGVVQRINRAWKFPLVWEKTEVK